MCFRRWGPLWGPLARCTWLMGSAKASKLLSWVLALWIFLLWAPPLQGQQYCDVHVTYPYCPCIFPDNQGRRAEILNVTPPNGHQTCHVNSGTVTCPNGTVCPYDSYGRTNPCGGGGGGGGGGCCGPQPTALVVLRGSVPVRADLIPECSYPLERVRPGPEPGMRYIMDDWAVYVRDGDTTLTAPARIASFSSSGFARGALSCIENARPGLSPRMLSDGDFLVLIGFPPPPRGHRWRVPSVNVDAVIPIPPGIPLPVTLTKALLRIEWDESGQVAQADVLHVTKPLQETRWLTDAVVRHMRLSTLPPKSMDPLSHEEVPQSDRFHRVVTYLIVDVRDSVIQLSNLWHIGPMCCCGEECCM